MGVGQDFSTKRRVLMSLAVKTVDAGYFRYYSLNCLKNKKTGFSLI